MCVRFRSTTLGFLFCTVFIYCVSGNPMESINVEDIEDSELKESVSQALAAADAAELSTPVSEEGDDDADRGRAPAPNLVISDIRRRGNLCGVFILCERGESGYPEARLFQGYSTRFYPSFLNGACRVSLVQGTCRGTGVSNFNHARLWPAFSEEFSEMCYYYERKFACTSGQVVVYRQTSGSHPIAVYKCRQRYEAHTVQFCMNKYSYYCRWRNPLTVPLPVSLARA